MHGSEGTPVPLKTWGGLVTLASPDSIPEGASPRCYDNDYIVGQTGTRSGLKSVYTYGASTVGPSPGTVAADIPFSGGTPWNSPGNVLLNTGVYATANLSSSGQASPVPAANSSTWNNPGNITSSSLFTTHMGGVLNGLNLVISGLAIPAGASISGLKLSYQGLVNSGPQTLFAALSFPGATGQSQALSNVLTGYTFGTPLYTWGLTLTPAMLNAGFTLSLAASGGSAIVSLNNAVLTVYYVLPGSISDGINVTSFGFSVPSTSTPQGFKIVVNGYSSVSPATLNVQMVKNGVAVGSARSVALPIGGVGPVSVGGSNDLFDAAWVFSDLNNTNFGFQLSVVGAGTTQALLGYATLAAYLAPQQANFDYVGTFTDQNGTVKNISLDADGNLWIEDVTNNPGVLTLALEGIAPNSFAVGVNGPGVEYLAFNDLTAGSDQPQQYTAEWIDRISQVGPGAPPVFTGQQATSNTFAITSITQPPANSDITDPGHISVLLWSAGPGSTAPGNVITVYYSPSFFGGSPQPSAQDMTLVNAFNAGNAVYVFLSGTPFGTGVYLVTSIGNALPPGVDHDRYYFTVQTVTSDYQHGTEVAGQYQMSVATMTMAQPVPGLTVGNQVTVSGASVADWDSTWTITQTPNSASMAITNTSVTASIATYSYSVLTGSPPAAGQLVTITNTTNANGALNLVNATIASATGGASGTFTIPVSVTSASSVPESGQATTAGTIFQFDPGLADLGTVTSPIFGNSTGGTLTFTASDAQLIGPGTRQGTVFFITRNGYWTAPAPPVIFTCSDNTLSIVVTQIPIGPPNVVARGIALTEPGQNGVPGGNFFTIPTEVDYTVQNVSYTATSFIINDNTSTTATLSFSDNVLLNATAIDVQGQNLFNLIEIGDPGWIVSYDSRNFYGLCRNKIQNFNNLSFDGGYLPATQLTPLGWSTPDIYGDLIVSPKFGDAYYIQNTSAGLLPVAGLISQTAYQDAYKQPILQPNTLYSVRVTARIPSGNTNGLLSIALISNNQTRGGIEFAFSILNTTLATYTSTGLLTVPFSTVPADLQLQISAVQLGAGADVEIDRVEVFPTAIPVLTTKVFGSYANDFESVDAVSGAVDFISENQQPVNGAVVMYDTFYALKDSSMYSLRSQPNLEPAQWDEPEVAQRAGACGINAYDFGEQWIVEACRNGIYLYEGGQPGKIMQEIYQIWDAINWSAKKSIWVRNDVTGRRLFVGIPLPTPNFWLPEAPTNANPQLPNVVLMCNYQGLDTGREIQAGPQMHTTMFGSLNAIDMRRKWSIWQIQSPYAAFVKTAHDQAFYICNGQDNSKVYALDPAAATDDGAPIDGLYTTAGLPTDAQREKIGLMDGNTRIGYIDMVADIAGVLQVRFLPNVLLGPNDSTVGYNPWTVPGGFAGTGKSLWNRKCSANFFAQRTYVELRGPDFNISALTLRINRDHWNAPWGVK